MSNDTQTDAGGPAIDATTFRLPPTEYMDETAEKNLIVLHFTASSSAQSVYSSWMQLVNGQHSRVATAYVVDVDGKIYEFFPPEKWGYHLGMTQSNPGWINDRRAVAIEIVNVGPLREDSANPDQLNWWPPGNEYKTKWCLKTEADRYIKAPFRGSNYFAAFTPPQVASVRGLVHVVADRFGIQKQLPPPDKRTVYDPVYFTQYKGIASHQNFRADKLDIGPAWDWTSLGI